MNMLRRKKKISLPQGAVPAIRKSICTGEETFGYIKDNHFTSLRLIHSRDEIYAEYDVKKEKIRVYRFWKEPLIRAYGREFYSALEAASKSFFASE